MSFMGKVHQARNEALTGRILNNGSGAPTSAGDFDGWAAADKSKSAGLRITGASTYEFFVDADKIAGGEEVVAVVDLVAQHTDNQITFGGPVGQEIRFQNDGSAVNSQSIMVQDTDLGEAREITITKVGQVRIEAKKL